MTAASPVPFDIVLAADLDRGIARGGELPWHISGDLKHFKELTVGAGRNAVLMGRRTWDSVPERFRPLPRRLNVVLSRRPEALTLPPGVAAAGSLEAGLTLAAAARVDDVFVVGGAVIYGLAFAHPWARRVVWTRVKARFGCDTRVPPLGPGWVEDSVSAERRAGELAWDVVVYVRGTP